MTKTNYLQDAGADTKGNRHTDNAQRHYAAWQRALLKAEKHRLRMLDHYTKALAEIGREGFLHYWTREFRPYLRGAAEQFAPAHESLTERLLRRR